MPAPTERHRQRAREWLSANVWPNTGRDQTRTLDPAIESLATLLAEVEGDVKAMLVRAVRPYVDDAAEAEAIAERVLGGE